MGEIAGSPYLQLEDTISDEIQETYLILELFHKSQDESQIKKQVSDLFQVYVKAIKRIDSLNNAGTKLRGIYQADSDVTRERAIKKMRTAYRSYVAMGLKIRSEENTYTMTDAKTDVRLIANVDSEKSEANEELNKTIPAIQTDELNRTFGFEKKESNKLEYFPLDDNTYLVEYPYLSNTESTQNIANTFNM